MLLLGAALIGLIGCVTTPPNPKPPPRTDELVAPPQGDPRVDDPAAAYPRETMNRLDAMKNNGSPLQNQLKGPGSRGGMGAGGMGGPGGY
jgi:hypothetical protein